MQKILNITYIEPDDDDWEFPDFKLSVVNGISSPSIMSTALENKRIKNYVILHYNHIIFLKS